MCDTHAFSYGWTCLLLCLLNRRLFIGIVGVLRGLVSPLAPALPLTISARDRAYYSSHVQAMYMESLE